MKNYEPDDGPLTPDQINQITKLNMNDKIKELLEQSGFQYITDDGIGWAGNYNASLPKFAELIVRECVNIADHSNVNGTSIIGERIKQYFGVEE